MQIKYQGNIEDISSLFEEINSRNRMVYIPHNEIVFAKVKRNNLKIKGLFCLAIGKFEIEQNTLNIQLKFRVKRYFSIIGLFIILFFIRVIFGGNVVINGDVDPGLWHRMGFSVIGIFFFLFPILLLGRLKREFRNKVDDLLK